MWGLIFLYKDIFLACRNKSFKGGNDVAVKDYELRQVVLDLDTPIKTITAFLSKTHTLKGIATDIGISERDLSMALKDTGHIYQDRQWVPKNKNFDDPIRERPLRDFVKLKPIFNQREVEKIVQLIDSRLSCEKEMNESDLSKTISDLVPIKKIKTQVKVDKTTLRSFDRFCLDYDLDKAAALTLALQSFMQAYK